MEYTGSKFTGTLSFDKDAFADNEIMNGKIYITVNEDGGYVDDIRGIVAKTAVIISPLPHVTLTTSGSTNSITMALKTSAGATVTPSIDGATGTGIPTAVMGTDDNANKLTITAGSAVGNYIVKLSCSAANEATSERFIMVDVVASA